MTDLEMDKEREKRELERKLAEEENQKLEEAQKEAKRKFIQGAQNEDELRAELIKIMGQHNANYENDLIAAEQEKKEQEERLKRRLQDRQKNKHEEYIEEREALEAEVDDVDPLIIEEQEKLQEENQETMKNIAAAK